jgi:hypothetical protein
MAFIRLFGAAAPIFARVCDAPTRDGLHNGCHASTRDGFMTSRTPKSQKHDAGHGAGVMEDREL